jgi:hypothetical protein
VIVPLITLKARVHALRCGANLQLCPLQETQERTRKRIKEDLKDSTTAYNEYAEVMLPKLKSRYVKKYSEVEVCQYSPFLIIHIHVLQGAKTICCRQYPIAAPISKFGC